jgi:hypothetical protein
MLLMFLWHSDVFNKYLFKRSTLQNLTVSRILYTLLACIVRHVSALNFSHAKYLQILNDCVLAEVVAYPAGI